MLRRTLRVRYPASALDEVLLRTELDWQRDITATAVSPERDAWDFEIESTASLLEAKPCLRRGAEFAWCVGGNRLLALGDPKPQETYPHFFGRGKGRVLGPFQLASATLGRALRSWVYLPPGYDENTLKRYPVLLMHDGHNAFFPEESFAGTAWDMDATLDRLDEMSFIDQCIVIALQSTHRLSDYTAPGYELYAQAVVTEVLPKLHTSFRTLRGPAETLVMGSSLGGVASLHLAWSHPDVFGYAVCISSTFGFRDDLLQRVRRPDDGSRRELAIYLDSGWPGDNYAATFGMAAGLLDSGLRMGDRLHFLVFPGSRHDEPSWAARLHVPVQLFLGRLARAQRARLP